MTCVEGMEMLRRHRPDCVLLDFNMPDMDGCAVAFQIRADADLRKTPIIMVTGEAQKELVSLHEYKVDGFFLKGWSLDRLLAMVESLLRRVDLDHGIIRNGDIRLIGSDLQVFRDSKLVTVLSREQFRLFSLLVEKSPDFVNETNILRHIYGVNGETDKPDAIRGLAHRLRSRLGAQLGHRVRSKAGSGWGYVQPRARSKDAA